MGFFDFFGGGDGSGLDGLTSGLGGYGMGDGGISTFDPGMAGGGLSMGQGGISTFDPGFAGGGTMDPSQGGGGWWPSLSWGNGPSMGGLGSMMGGIGGALSGIPSYLSGMFGGGGSGGQMYQNNSPFQTPGNSDYLGNQSGGAMGGLSNFLQNNGALGNLGIMGGLGLLGYGLSQGDPSLNLPGIFNGQQNQTNDQINSLINTQQGQYGQYLGNLGQSRAQGMQSLNDVLNQGTSDAMKYAMNTRMGDLNARGLLNGPSGALDEALAQEASKIQQRNIPYLAQYQGQTQNLQDQGMMGNLQNTMGLQQSGMQRNFGLQDQINSASLKQQLLNAQLQNQKRQGLMGAGSTLLGAGIGGQQGAMLGSQIGGSLEGALGRGADYSFANPPTYGRSMMGGGYGGGGYGGGMGGF